MDTWWKTNKKYSPVNVKKIIIFNRLIQQGYGVKTASGYVNWCPSMGHNIKTLIWGKRSPRDIHQFCLDNNLITSLDSPI